MRKSNRSKRSKVRKTASIFDFEKLENRNLMATMGMDGGMALQHEAHQAITSPLRLETNVIGQQDNAQRIVNGEQTDEYEAVGFVGPLGCTGTLISPTHVLTAAHCLEGISNSGATFEVNGQTYQSSAVTIHPDYDPNQFDAGNDLAIIELNRPVSGIQPMEIMRETPQVGTMLTLVGFGEGGTSQGGFDPNDTGKQVGETELEGVTNHHLTWNFDSHNESNTAPGDSGGPAFITVNDQQLIAGVTSGGSGDAHQLGDQSFDTRIDVHADWIDSIVGEPGDGGGGGGGGSRDDHADSPGDNATKIILDESGLGSESGELEQTGDRDAFSFKITDSGETTISLSGTSNNLDTYLRVYDADGNQIAENDDANGTFDSSLTLQLDAGTYFLTSAAYSDDGTGTYDVNIAHQPDPSDGGGYATFTNDNPQQISDVGTDRVVSIIDVNGLQGSITDINVQVDIQHTWVSDLRLVLVAPDRTRVVLVNRQGDDGQDFDSTVFDQDATDLINRGEAPFSGVFRPARSLDQLNGKMPNGRWRLVVLDRADFDGGQLNEWSLEVSTDQSRSKRFEARGYAAIQVDDADNARNNNRDDRHWNQLPIQGPMPLARVALEPTRSMASSIRSAFGQQDDEGERNNLLDLVFSDQVFDGFSL